MVYLDNSATTAPSETVKRAVTEALECFGNPSSLHSLGFEAQKKLDAARAAVMTALGAKSGRLVFTSCGSEANNMAIIGSAIAKSRRTATRVLTTDCEHPSVDNAIRELEKMGFETVRIPTRGGALDMAALDRALERPIFLASFMLVNNEVGSYFDVKEAFSMIKAAYPDAICHCDAVQGFLKVKFTPASIGADLVSISGHKIHALKGIGALWVSDAMIRAKKIVPIIVGGGQEGGYRSGTENTVGIAALAAAAKEGGESFAADAEKMRGLREYAISLIGEKCPEITLNLPRRAAPHVLSITLPSIKSETMLHYLSSKGICVSSGSACSSHSQKTSATLLAFGLDPKAADCTLRVSLCRYNEKEDIEALAAALQSGLSELIRIK
ncbi:MAG: cysteine desulfurase [Clostridia bacterium]|nr:cysteine desulfurase [Clostridia bacterium]